MPESLGEDLGTLNQLGPHALDVAELDPLDVARLGDGRSISVRLEEGDELGAGTVAHLSPSDQHDRRRQA